MRVNPSKLRALRVTKKENYRSQFAILEVQVGKDWKDPFDPSLGLHPCCQTKWTPNSSSLIPPLSSILIQSHAANIPKRKQRERYREQINHILFPSNVTGMLDEVKVSWNIRECMKNICEEENRNHKLMPSEINLGLHRVQLKLPKIL